MANPVKIKAMVQSVIKHTDSVVSYVFKPQGRVPKFRAGQFLHLSVDAYDPSAQWPESRVFSIASAPSERRDALAVTISVKGAYTERIVNTLEVGSECWLKLPYGEFLFPPDQPLVLVAGGVGITPYLALMKEMLETQSQQNVLLYYGIRSAEHYLFADELNHCEVVLPNFKKTIYCEDVLSEAEIGVLNIEAIHKAADVDSLFYLSGPPVMIAAFKQRLMGWGVSVERIMVDDWE